LSFIKGEGNTAADMTASMSSRWREDWQSATVINSSLVDDLTIRSPGFHLHRRQWSLLNRFRTGQGHCGTRQKKWDLTHSGNKMCVCSNIQTISHIVDSCPLTKLDGGLHRLHTADKAAVDWLMAHRSIRNITLHWVV